MTYFLFTNYHFPDDENENRGVRRRPRHHDAAEVRLRAAGRNGCVPGSFRPSFLGNYDPVAIEVGTVDGKVFGVPLTQQAYLVWYNKDVFTANNIGEPKNWEEFLAAYETLKQAGIAPIVVPGKEEWVVNVFAGLAYSDLFSKEPKWLTKVANGEVKWTDEGSVHARRCPHRGDGGRTVPPGRSQRRAAAGHPVLFAGWRGL
jgi:hypothetical protein